MQAADILETLGYSERTRELAKIAGYMHDIGNAVNRHEHALTGAVMAFRILDNLGMPAEEIAQVVSRHWQSRRRHRRAGQRNRRGADPGRQGRRAPQPRAPPGRAYRGHSRPRQLRGGILVARHRPPRDAVTLCLTIDTSICAVMDYFEIFLTRMLLCRRAAEFFGPEVQIAHQRYNAALIPFPISCRLPAGKQVDEKACRIKKANLQTRKLAWP